MASAAARRLSTAEIERELRDCGAGDPRILALYLFGSRARHEETEQSDVDVGVLWNQRQTLHDVLLLEDALQQRLGLEIDVVEMARYRNRMVHFYDDILPGELYDILAAKRGDVEELLAAILSWLAAPSELSDNEL